MQRLVEALEASEMIEADEARSMQVSPDPPPTLLHPTPHRTPLCPCPDCPRLPERPKAGWRGRGARPAAAGAANPLNGGACASTLPPRRTSWVPSCKRCFGNVESLRLLRKAPELRLLKASACSRGNSHAFLLDLTLRPRQMRRNLLACRCRWTRRHRNRLRHSLRVSTGCGMSFREVPAPRRKVLPSPRRKRALQRRLQRGQWRKW